MSSIKDFEMAQRIHIATVQLQAEIVTLRNAAVLATERAERAESRAAELEAMLGITPSAESLIREARAQDVAAIVAEKDALLELLREARDWFHPRDPKVPGALMDMCDRIDAAIDAAKEKP
jgi:hypothetical protein